MDLRFLVSLLLLPVLASGCTQPAAEVDVLIEGYEFLPATLNVTKGTTVVFTNEDRDPHSAVDDGGAWATGILSQGEQEAVTFDDAGTYAYYCSVHPTMRATLIVE